MKKILVLFYLISSSVFAQQEYRLSGSLTDEHNSEISFGDVLLYKKGKLIKYTTISKGKFIIEDILKDTYTLKISSLGFVTFKKTITFSKDLNLTIILKEETTVLDEVQLVASKKLIEYKGGNTIINVENTIWSKESSAVDLISKLPNIQLSADRSAISMIGKGSPLLYLGGQRITMDDFLSIAIDNIKSIEIIQNPSSKYEANGRAVILIHRKKSDTQGIRLTLTEKASQKRYFNNYFSSLLNIKANRFEYKLNASYNQIKVWESNGAEYDISNQNIRSNYLVKAVTKRPQFVFGGGVYYQINQSNYISLSTRFRTQKEPFIIDTQTNIFDNGQEQAIRSLSDNIGERQFSSSNFNYTREFKGDGNIFIGGQFTSFNKSIYNEIFNQFSNPNSESSFKRDQRFEINSYTLKSDYQQTFDEKYTLEAGINYAGTNSISTVTVVDASTSLYKENNSAIYTQFAHNLKNVNYSMGIRLENTAVTINANDLELLNGKTTTSYLFPKANLEFNLDSIKKLNFNFSTSITRPNYTTVTSTSAFINPALEFRGNLDLKPTLTKEASVALQLKNKRISGYYYKSKNPVYYSLAYDELREISVMSPKNFNEEYGIGLTLDFPINYKFWSSNNSIRLSYNTLIDDSSFNDKATPFGYFYTSHQFKINPTSSIHLNAWGLTKRKQGIFQRNAQFVCNLSFQKRLFNTFDLTLNYNNIFNSINYRDSYEINQVSANSVFYVDLTEFAISLKYTLNSIKKSSYKNKDVDEQLNRVR